MKSCVVVAVHSAAAPDTGRQVSGFAQLQHRDSFHKQRALRTAQIIRAINRQHSQPELAEPAGDTAGKLPAMVVRRLANAGLKLVGDAEPKLKLAELRRHADECGALPVGDGAADVLPLRPELKTAEPDERLYDKLRPLCLRDAL